jgi:hypothetical protein
MISVYPIIFLESESMNRFIELSKFEPNRRREQLMAQRRRETYQVIN